MGFLTGNPSNTWQPTMTANTTDPSYWLNWKFFLCALFLLISMIFASILIWKYERFHKRKPERRENGRDTVEPFHEDEAWKICLKGIHPAWLLAYRIIALIVLFSLITANVIEDGGGIFYFYTQWTFALVTIYFALASTLSIYGCCKYGNRDSHDAIDHFGLDTERGTYVAPTLEGSTDTSNMPKNLDAYEEHQAQETAGVWGYALQIIYQMCAGAVMLTDSVFWTILYPFLTAKDYELNFMIACMHSVNAVFLLGDTLLNCLRFPLFRIAYFVLWTGVFVIFQWIIHVCVNMWWPYPFLDLSSQYAPLWYLGVGLMHIPCYGIFALIVSVKHMVLSKTFPGSYQSMR